ncbi:HU family DNA-binding protein [Bacteroides finegoldii]|uniref:HU family DNA-binding protein n=1 Tax=Bacteroides finegoldii TaxID=338188 RepID=UPI001899B5A9|nr:HU family DNA-binding protein [Bacteroides finegoldii]
MTKAELVNTIVLETGINKKDVLAIVESLMAEVKNALEREEPVYLRGFGSFIIKHRAEKTARNITKNTTLIVPAHNIPAFKPAKEFIKPKIRKQSQWQSQLQ